MTISIQGLRFQAILGILPHERTTPQTIEVSLKATYTYRKDRFLDYAKVRERIVTLVQREKFHLIEEALDYLFQDLKHRFPPIETLEITICKPDILPDCRVCVGDFRAFL